MTPINFGFLMYPIQAVDAIGPMDILNNVCRDFVEFTEPHLADKGLEVNFFTPAQSEEPLQLATKLVVKPSNSFTNCPKLDYLLIGGGYPAWVKNQMPEETKDFIRKCAKECKAVFTTCTGGFTLAETGVLDGLSATTNHEAIPKAKEMYPKVNWIADKDWVIDGNGKFWTGAGAVAGMDMVAEWIAQTYGEEILGVALRSLTYQRRDVDGNFIGRNVCILEGKA